LAFYYHLLGSLLVEAINFAPPDAYPSPGKRGA